MTLQRPLPDVDENWKLHSVGLLFLPLIARFCPSRAVSVVFFSQSHPSTQTCEESAYAAKLFVKCLFRHPFRYIGILVGAVMPMLRSSRSWGLVVAYRLHVGSTKCLVANFIAAW